MKIRRFSKKDQYLVYLVQEEGDLVTIEDFGISFPIVVEATRNDKKQITHTLDQRWQATLKRLNKIYTELVSSINDTQLPLP